MNITKRKIVLSAWFVVILTATPLFTGCPYAHHGDAAISECLSRVKEIHGGAGPWAVVGYRIGQRGLKELDLPRQSFSAMVVHYAPAEVQYSCIADGLQAATGARMGKLNLRLIETPVDSLKTTLSNRETGRELTFTLRPELVQSIQDIPRDRLEAEGRRVAGLPDDQIFQFSESKSSSQK